MKYFTKEVKIGLVGIAALCTLVYGLNYLKGIHLFRPTTYFYVKYENINGLTKSSPVYADGYQVGIVRNIYYDYTKPKNVLVEIGLDTEMRLPQGTYADLEVEMLGTVKMNLKLSDHTHGIHTNGDTIPGIVSNGLMESVNTIMPQIQSLIPKLDSILTSVNKIAGDENIPAILSNIENTTANLKSTTKQFNQFAQKDLPLLTQKLHAIGNNFEDISNNLKSIDYAETFNKIDSTINNIKLITEQLNNKNSSIGMLLNDNQLYNNLNNTATNAASLLEDLQTNPKRYVHFSLFGRKDK